MNILKLLSVAFLLIGLLSFAFPVMAQGRGGPSSAVGPNSNVRYAYPWQCDSYIDSNNDSYRNRGILSSSIASNTVYTVPEQFNILDSGYMYNLLPIFLIIIITYGTTYLLSARKVISTMSHRRIWNIVLGVSAIATFILALLLILPEEYKLIIQLTPDINFWHVETGIVMGIVAAFHITWHWRYFFNSKPGVGNKN